MAEQYGTEKALSAKQRETAILVAEDDLSDVDICNQVGIGRTTLHRWKLNPAFVDAVDEHTAELERQMVRLSVTKRRKRLAVLNDLHEKALTVIDARALEYGDIKEAAGGHTGLVVRDIKAVGSGPSAQIVEVWGVDVSLMREIRAIEEQAAKELGQWVDKADVSGSIKREYVIITGGNDGSAS